MGLDMYLYAETYTGGGYDHIRKAAEQGNDAARAEVARFDAILAATGIDRAHFPGANSANARVQVAYWRKANAIHAWFVKHCQNGVDECQLSYVDSDKLTTLLETCRTIREGVTLGEKVVERGFFGDFDWYPNVEFSDTARGIIERELPPTAGFFFGSTELNYDYVVDLDKTISQIENVIEHTDGLSVDFYYRSSW